MLLDAIPLISILFRPIQLTSIQTYSFYSTQFCLILFNSIPLNIILLKSGIFPYILLYSILFYSIDFILLNPILFY